MKEPEPQKARQEVARTVLAEKQAAVRTLETLRFEEHFASGPLPPPEMLKRYNDALPNGAERIMAMAEREQAQAHQMRRWGVFLTAVGQVGGFALIAFAMGGAFYLVLHNKSLEAFFSFFSGVGILLGGGYLSSQRKRPPADKAPQQKS